MSASIQEYIKKHPRASAIISVCIFLFWNLPQWLGTVWPLFSDKPLPQWLAERRWPGMTPNLFSWVDTGITVGIFVLLGMVLLTTRQQKRPHKRELDQIPTLTARLVAQQEDIAKKYEEITRLTKLLKEQKPSPSAAHESPTWPLLTGEQRHTLRSFLTVFPHQERRIEIGSQSFPDCAALARDLSEIFQVSGWDIGPSPTVELSQDPPEGIRVYHAPYYRYADTVTQALLCSLGPAYGVISQQRVDHKATRMPLLIFIGRKPR